MIPLGIASNVELQENLGREEGKRPLVVMRGKIIRIVTKSVLNGAYGIEVEVSDNVP